MAPRRKTKAKTRPTAAEALNSIEARLKSFPKLAKGVVRIVYVRGLDGRRVVGMQRKGYVIVDVLGLPNESTDERCDYLRKLVQAMVDGTVDIGKDERASIELEMKSLGMLDTRNLRSSGSSRKKTVPEDLQSMLAWDDSRYTRAGSSTVVAANRLAAKAQNLKQD